MADPAARLRFGRPLEGAQVRLGPRHLYMVPTRFGWLWLATTLLLQLLGIQLQRNGPLLLSFLMLGLFLLGLHLTPFNLLGLELACGEPPAGFAGGRLAYPLQLRTTNRCEGLQLGFEAEPNGLEPPRRLDPGRHALVMPWTPRRRGRQSPGCLRLQTTAPLGLFVCWTRWQPGVAQLVYPARRAGAVQLRPQPSGPAGGLPQATVRRDGGEEWHDLRPHRPEDAPSRLAWTLVAQGRGSFSKRFASPAVQAPLLAPDPALPQEQALEHLSERIWRLHGQGASYGLVLADQQIPPGHGSAHRDRCLTALALAT
ncbi:MAG: hypothetical protein VKJ05_02890 [Synechococcaceae cyanobacterium]|nr:hypothetical protein [Synechococcaceae cyanobacterium]